MKQPKARTGHATGLTPFYTKAWVEFDREKGSNPELDREALAASLAHTLQTWPDIAAQSTRAHEPLRPDHLTDGQHLMLGLTRASVAARTLRLARLLDEAGYDSQALPQDRWDALVYVAANLRAWPDWPPS